MHDGEDAGLLVIALFLGLVVVEEATNGGVAIHIGLDEICVDDGVQLAGNKHVFQRLVVRKPRQPEVGGGDELHVLVDLRVPIDGFVGNAIFLLENAAHPKNRAHLIGLHAHLLADEILGLTDALRCVHENELMAKPPMQKHRNALEGMARVLGEDEGGGGDLRHIELPVAQEPPVTGAGVDVGQDRQVDPVRLHCSVFQRAHDLVVAAGQCEMNVAHEQCAFYLSMMMMVLSPVTPRADPSPTSP